ncbi:MAG: hypothetical protein QHH09_01755 [Microgenomates group bacterium]|jgi:hypothetical protein|nr:hypothetical protein [Microgenomates group bacterium]
MKILVTHISPDLDAIAACWLIQKFLPGWKKATIKFVPAGETLDNQPVDSNLEIIHVDTGLGKFDHHQTTKKTSATKLVFEYLVNHQFIKPDLKEPLERIVFYINETDHFQEAYFPDPTADYYDFCLHQLVDSLRFQLYDNLQLIDTIKLLLDAELTLFKNKVKAEKEIKKGFVFQSKFGQSIAMETANEEAVKLALKMGYHLVIKKDPVKGHARLKTLPEKKYDLTPVYEKIKSLDKKGSWFLHISKHMLLNGSAKNPRHVATPLSLKKLIEITKKV